MKENEKIENLQQNFWTAVKMREEIEAGVEVKADSEQQKAASKGHFLHMRQKIVEVKNSLHLINNGSIQNIR